MTTAERLEALALLLAEARRAARRDVIETTGEEIADTEGQEKAA